MKNNYTITCYADLEREELRVKKRLKQQEQEIKERLKTLPEEIVTVGTTKIITGILNGTIFKSAVSIVKTIGSLFFNKDKDADSKSSIMDIIKNIIKNNLTD